MAGGLSVGVAETVGEPDIVGIVVAPDVGEVVGDGVAVGDHRSTFD